VGFVVVEGNGTVTGGSGVTGADGTFGVGTWVLGVVGTNTLAATSGGVFVLFTATATAAPSSAITRRAGNKLVRRCGSGVAPSVRVTDQGGDRGDRHVHAGCRRSMIGGSFSTKPGRIGIACSAGLGKSRLRGGVRIPAN
jgi:hypothetical protein